MSYFQLRISPAPILGKTSLDVSQNELQPFYLGIKLLLSSEFNIREYITCYEKLNKFGEPTIAHFHINFVKDDLGIKKDTIAKRLKKYFVEYGLPSFRGNSQYSLQMLAEPDDYFRWMRYCMKERVIDQLTNLSWDPEQIKLQRALSQDERKRAIASNIQYRNKYLEKVTWYDKLEIYLLNKKNLKTKSVIFVEIQKYYAKEKKGFNWDLINKNTNLYMARQKLITPLAFYLSKTK